MSPSAVEHRWSGGSGDLQEMEENFRTEGLTVGPTAASTKKSAAGDKPKG